MHDDTGIQLKPKPVIQTPSNQRQDEKKGQSHFWWMRLSTYHCYLEKGTRHRPGNTVFYMQATKAIGSIAPGLGLGAPSKVSHQI